MLVLPLGWPVRGEPDSPAAAQKGNGVGKGFGFDSACMELNWKVEKLVGWSDGAMLGRGSWSA